MYWVICSTKEHASLVRLRGRRIGKKRKLFKYSSYCTDKELDRCCLVTNNSMGILGTRKIATNSLGYGGIDRSPGFLVAG